MWVFLLSIFLAALIYYKVKFWPDRNFTHVSSWTGYVNLWNVMTKRKHFLEIIVDIYNNYPNDRYVGFTQFGIPSLLIRDLELIKQIGVKDFDNFPDHMHLFDADIEPIFCKSVVHLHGDKWRQMRATLSPVFTSSKIKNMYHLMVECAENLSKHFRDRGEVDVEMRDVSARFANDVIATTAFGIRVDSVKDPNDEFYIMAKKLTEPTGVQLLKITLLQLLPKLIGFLRMRLLPENVTAFFTKIIMSNIRNRVDEGIVRPDLIHLLLEAQKGNLKHDIRGGKEEGFATVEESQIGKSTNQMELTDDHIVAQAMIFFFGGLDTVASASCLIAYELAVNPGVQKKLQEEIDEAIEKNGDKVSYDALVAMKYLDQVICETLRMWPPLFQTDRYCVKDYTIEPKNPKERALLVEKGTGVAFPIMAIHRDPRYFPDPDRFDPERFSDENKSKILAGTYMPFGIGPRNCIGSRFALLEMKILFFHLLASFDIVPNEKTDIPLKISPKKINISPENGFQLTLKPRNIA